MLVYRLDKSEIEVQSDVYLKCEREDVSRLANELCVVCNLPVDAISESYDDL